MNHLDEGTIHAWLDGGLSAAQSAEVDAHVKSCGECSARVVEARGLIAASSRILTALDDVPSNVTPKRAVVAPRRRRMAPWVSGLAAAAVLMVLWRAGDVEQPTPLPQIQVPAIPPVSVPEPRLNPIDPAPLPPAKSASIARGGQGVAAQDLAGAQAAAPSAPPASEAITTAMAASDERESMAGCYRLPAQPSPAFGQIAAGAEVAAARAARPDQRGAAAAAAVAPSAANQRKTSADAALPQTIVRLDSLGLVRNQADSVIGSWEVFRNDSARVTTNARSLFLSGGSKVRCP